MIAVMRVPRHSLYTKAHKALKVNTPESFTPRDEMDILREVGGERV